MLKKFKLELNPPHLSRKLIIRWRYHEDFPKVLFPDTGLMFGQRVERFQSNFALYGPHYAVCMAFRGKEYLTAYQAYEDHADGNLDRKLMFLVQQAKFKDQRLLADLMTTVGMELIYRRDDQYWGQSDGQGHNWLGKIIMAVRAEAEAHWPDNVLKPAPGSKETTAVEFFTYEKQKPAPGQGDKRPAFRPVRK